MDDQIVNTVYYQQAGADNTQRTLLLALERAEALGIEDIVVATTSGNTGLAAARLFAGRNLVIVSHSTGFGTPNEQELEPALRDQIETLGARVLTCQHAFGGVGRAIRRKFGSYQIDEIIAFTLRSLGQGTKVACEITLMAVDAGLVPAEKEVIAIGGTGRGADTAAVIYSANSQDLFDLRILEILCKPRG